MNISAKELSVCDKNVMHVPICFTGKECPHIKHSFDVWHAAKNLAKKITKVIYCFSSSTSCAFHCEYVHFSNGMAAVRTQSCTIFKQILSYDHSLESSQRDEWGLFNWIRSRKKILIMKMGLNYLLT